MIRKYIGPRPVRHDDVLAEVIQYALDMQRQKDKENQDAN